MRPQQVRTPGSQPGAAIEQREREADCAEADDERKRFATVQAHLALAGVAVYPVDGGGFVVAWRAITKELHDLDELEAHARRIGAMP